jgi:hypothetical protein
MSEVLLILEEELSSVSGAVDAVATVFGPVFLCVIAYRKLEHYKLNMVAAHSSFCQFPLLEQRIR